MENTFQILINGEVYKNMNRLPTLNENKVDAIWHLGAKFGGVIYNKMVKDGLIKWGDNQVVINLK